MNRKILAAAFAVAITLSAAASAPAAVNLKHYLLSGWSGTVVPKLDTTTTYFSCAVTNPLLPGNFYWNMSGANVGDESTSGAFDVTFYLDGALKQMSAAGPTGTVFIVPNQGPLNNPQGGRHIVSSWIDAFHAVAETDETDNVQGYPYCWAGIQLSVGSPVVHDAPPPAQGGWDHNVVGSLWYNCSGFKFSLSPICDWTVVSIYSDDPTADYDLRLHEDNGDIPTLGYATSIAGSFRGAARVDALVMRNEDLFSAPIMNAGVLNLADDTADFTMDLDEGGEIAFGAQETITMAAADRVCLRQLAEATDLALTTSIYVNADPAVGELNAAIFDPDAEPAALDGGAMASGVTAVDGRLRLDLVLTPGDTYGIVVWRDPEDGSGPWEFTLKTGTTPADLVPDAGTWYAPLVPTNSLVKPGNPAYLPAELDADYTYLNYRFINDGAAAAKNPGVDVDLDGTPVIESSLGYSVADGEAVEYNSVFYPPSPWEIDGGRHTLAMVLDPDGKITEKDETNNVWGYQLCWKPSNLHYGAIAQYTSAPPPMYGGHGEVTETVPLYNCSGFRLPVREVDPDGWWRAAALYSTHQDHDLRLHEGFVGNQGGFEGALATSSLPLDRLDFVIANLNEVPDEIYDVSVFCPGTAEPTWGYYIQSMASTWVANDIGGIYGPFDIYNPSLFNLLEFHIPAGDVAVRLLSGSPTMDWGIAIFPPNGEFMTLDDAMAAAWGNGPGKDVWVSAEVPADGYCCVMVWKAGGDQLNEQTDYRIWIEPGFTDVVPGSPAPLVTSLGPVHPNPFNPRTTVEFELARAGRTRLAVYDLKGALVRVLADAELPVGSHEAVWDGHFSDGRAAPSGVYVLRLEAEGALDSRRISLVR